jgi:protein-S-isoprenylcysteine O-methyltransferase Ste14
MASNARLSIGSNQRRSSLSRCIREKAFAFRDVGHCGHEMMSFALPIVTTVTLYVARTLELRVRKTVVAGKIQAPATLVALILSGSAVAAAAMTEYIMRGQPADPVAYFVGLAAGLAAFWLRAAAARALGRWWTKQIELRSDQPLIRTGPFARVRHPIYAAAILELLSPLIMLQATWSWLVFGFIFLPALIVRIRREEQALIEHFGEPYRAYIREIPALLPRLGQTKP